MSTSADGAWDLRAGRIDAILRTMSSENIDVVRAVYDAWNLGDMEAVREACDPSVIVLPPEAWPESGPFVGREAVMRAFAQLRDTFDEDWQELISDVVDVGERVLVRTVWHGIGRGPEMKQESTAVFTVRNGQVHQIEFFSDHGEALEAVGASKQGGRPDS